MISVIVLVFGCLAALIGHSLILKATHSLDRGLGGIELEMTWKSPCGGLALIVSETTMPTFKSLQTTTANNVVGYLPQWWYL